MKLVAVTASPLDTAGIAHLSSSRTLRNFFAKIRQPDVGSISFAFRYCPAWPHFSQQSLTTSLGCRARVSEPVIA